MRKDDLVRLRHMLDAAKEAQSYTAGKSKGELDANRMLTLSVVRLLEIVGEAASKVSEECKVEFPEVPWANMIAMRNRLIHAYFDINLSVVWETIKEDLPSLIASLETIVKDGK